MNIFVLDTDPKLCAQYHCNKHVVKMILETVQMLSAVHRLEGKDVGYKLTHKNHPCTKWVRESLANYGWTCSLLEHLHDEWRFRFNHPHTKIHKSFGMYKTLPIMPDLPNKDMTPFALAMPDKFKTDDPVESYRAYYLEDKKHLLDWGNRGEPSWIKSMKN